MRQEYIVEKPKYTSATATIPPARTGYITGYESFNGRLVYRDEATLKYLRPFEEFRSAELAYVDGAEVIFTHGWNNFDPITDWFSVNGRRATIDITTTQIKLRAGANGINIGRKNGNLNEVNLNDARWLLFVTALRRLDNV